MHRRSLPLVALTLALAAAGVACGSDKDPGAAGASAGPASTAVSIHTFAFGPNPVRVKVGATVTWKNDDQILHTVTAGQRTYFEDGPSKGQAKDIQRSGEFDQKLDGVGSTFSYTFTKAGTFHYLCTIHPGMDAEVDVS
jgi:plastocyanin